MGRTARTVPARLPEKLAEIRLRLEYSQLKMAGILSKDGIPIDAGAVSRFESGKREPSLITILRYARLIKVPADILIDDKLNLPK